VISSVDVESPVSSIQFHPDGLILATGCQDGVVRLWDLKTLSLATEFPAGTSSVVSVAFSENGYHFAATYEADSFCKFWDLRKLAELYTLELSSPATRVRFDHSGKYVGVSHANILR
jgi:pre-mRNA-processing factor 19